MARGHSGATVRSPSISPRSWRLGGRLPVLLALFLVVAVVDAVLLRVVLSGPATDPAVAPPSVPAADTTDTADTPDTPDAAPAVSRQQLLDLADASFAVESRAPGSCAAGGAELRISDDGGRTWMDIAPPRGALFALAAPQPGALSAVGANARCAGRSFRSSDLGRTWTRAPDAVGIWYAGSDPDGRSILHSPAGDIASPCRGGAPVRHLEGVSLDRGFALCAGEPIYRTGDSGRTWQAGARISAVAISFPAIVAGFAAATDDPACPGIRLLATTDAGVSWSDAACVEDVGDPGAEVGLDFVDEVTGMLRAGADTFVTSDGGATWTRP